MYLEFSLKKVWPLLAVALILATGVAFYLSLNRRADVASVVADFMTRERAYIAYWFHYKAPLFSLANSYSATLGPNESVSTTTPSGTARAVPVLAYHGEGTNTDMPQSVFLDQMRTLKAAGWHTITMEQFRAFMKDGAALPARSFLLTFDDGRRDTFYAFDPVLRDLGFNAVMFMITNFSLPDKGKPSTYYLSKTELQYMLSTGRWELESHGAEDHGLFDVPTATSTSVDNLQMISGGHFLTDKFWLPAENRKETSAEYTDRVSHDLLASKQKIEDTFGTSVIAFAFPFNDTGQASVNFPGAKDILAQVVPATYTFAFTQVSAGKRDFFNYPDPNQDFIKRLEPTADWNGTDLATVLQSATSKDLPFTQDKFGTEWSTNWGSITPGRVLTMKAAPDTTGASAFLDGSGWWKNYTMTAHVDFTGSQGSELSLVVRNNEGSGNSLACVFSDTRMSVQQRGPGGQAILATKNYTGSGNKSDVVLSANVSGNTLTCSGYGDSISAGIASGPKIGGVGLEVWNKTLGSATVRIKSVSVQ